ncbi:MAG: class I SAM-dependent rRNA methyltransferase [Candidatus Izemoplasmatales bacterium]|jgi:23S rRNA (cytosine1962-C5)-methyltransferase
MNPCRVKLKPTEEIRIRQGHPWVYSNEIASIEGDIVSGDIVSVFASDHSFVGKGFLNTASKIFVRILTRKDIDIQDDFFRDLIHQAHQMRINLGYNHAYRAFFSDADGIPGLIVDKYEDYLVMQILSLGVAIRKQLFIDLLQAEFLPVGIYERSDVPIRKKEGLPEYKGIVYGTVPNSIIIHENEILMSVDIPNGQKTGTFLDQQANHAAIRPYVTGKTVLDCFSHTGGFGLHAAKYGAKTVECVDISTLAISEIEANARQNDLHNVTALKADVFALLRDYQTANRLFDVIILDPPAFTKNLDKLDKAYAGYKEINLQAMKLITSSGYLVTCSCSHYMTPELFLEMLQEAAVDANRIAQMIEFRTQGKDHPMLLGIEESLYLKCVILRINDKH